MEDVFIKRRHTFFYGEKAWVKERKRDLKSSSGNDRIEFFHASIHELNLFAVEAFDIRADVNFSVADGVENL